MAHPSFTLCLCPDSHLLNARLNALAAEDKETWQRHVFWGDEGLTPAFWEHLTLQGLFATPKQLVIRNAHNIPVDTLRQLSPYLEKLNGARSLVWPILCLEVSFERGVPKVPVHIQRLPFYVLAEQKRWVETVVPLDTNNISTFLRAESARIGLALTAAQLGQLARVLPHDAAAAASELAKLALMTNAAGALPDSAIASIEHTQELGIFELMRSLQQSAQPAAVWQSILEDRLGGENSVFAFISILLREGRVLWQTLAGTPPFLPPQVAAGKKVIAQSLGFAGIAKIWELALHADKGIKTGERSPEQAFELLAADLFLLFKSR